MSEGFKDSKPKWKTPDELLKLQRMKQKQRALQARINKPSNSQPPTESEANSLTFPGTQAAKRKNPFSRSGADETATLKKPKLVELDASGEDTIFQLLASTHTPEVKNIESAYYSEPATLPFTDQNLAQENVPKPLLRLPVDWSLKTRLRLLSSSTIPGNNLKTNQEASGMTSFVRCLNLADTAPSLDISPGARFHQATLYWQHPSLPWLTLFPRNSKSNHGLNLGEAETRALGKAWADSFRSLFQLCRSRQCPYFYVCANSFTALFRAAGVGGRVETHAFLTPTSRGIRAALKQQEIEFTMPLKRQEGSTRFSDGTGNSSLDESSIHQPQDEEDDDTDEEAWLESLGVEAEEIKRINQLQQKKQRLLESEEDFSDQSLLLVEGVDCQAFFNFLLNFKSATVKVGRLAGIPPTLLAPVAFQGATLQALNLRSSKVRLDGQDYFSMELKGVVLPHVLPYIARLLAETKDTFSVTLSTAPSTIALTKAAVRLLEELNKENDSQSDHVFGRENLSDCGLLPFIREAMCRITPDAVHLLDRVCYSKEQGGYFL